MVHHVFDEIVLQESEGLNIKYETHENIDDEVYEDELYERDKMILDEK